MQTTTGNVMDDFSSIPGGVSGLLGIAAASVVWAALKLRNLFSKDAVDRSADAAYKALIEDQAAQLVVERRRNQELRESSDAMLEAERKRTEAMRVSLDAAVGQISSLRKQVADLSEQVDKLQRQIAAGRAP